MKVTRDQADRVPNRPLGEERAHYWMVQRMARATGVDLVRAMDEDALTQDAWAQMVTRCRGCAWTEGCARWLDQDDDAARACPDGCRNQQRFAALKRASAE